MVALDAMRFRGAGRDVVRAYPFFDRHIDHETAFPFALATARRFFDGGFTAVGWPAGS